jgi:hypothetical protein
VRLPWSKNANLLSDVLKAEEQPWYFLNPQSDLENYYYRKTIDKLNPKELVNLKGIVLTHASKVEKSLVALTLDWFRPDLLAEKHFPELDITVYCKNASTSQRN